MPAAQALTVSQTPSDFVASNAPGSAFLIPEKGLAWPNFDVRLANAPDSDDVPGSLALSATLGQGTLPLTINVHGTSTADLQTKRRALEAAFSQFTYTLTITVDGEDETYTASMAWPKWGAIDSGMVSEHMAVATLTVPVNPMGS